MSLDHLERREHLERPAALPVQQELEYKVQQDQPVHLVRLAPLVLV